MSNYFLIFCAALILIERNQGASLTLAKIVLIEIILTLLIKTLLKDFGIYTIDNMAFIVILRNIPIFIAIQLIFKYRKSYSWIIIALLYSAAFAYNALTFHQLFRVGEVGAFMDGYQLFMRVIMLFMAACLFLNSFGGGIKNYLGSRLYFITSRSHTVGPASQNMLSRINRLWSRS